MSRASQYSHYDDGLEETKAWLEHMSRQSIEAIVNNRDFEYQSEIGREVNRIKAAGFKISYGASKIMSNEELMQCCKAKAEAFPGYRIDVIDIFSDVDMEAGIAKVYLNTQIAENYDLLIKGCSLLEWRRIRSGSSKRWVCTAHNIMRGFAGGLDFAG